MRDECNKFRFVSRRQKGIMIKDYAETMLGGRHCSMVIRRGVCLKLTDLSGGSNVGMLMYNLENTTLSA